MADDAVSRAVEAGARALAKRAGVCPWNDPDDEWVSRKARLAAAQMWEDDARACLSAGFGSLASEPTPGMVEEAACFQMADKNPNVLGSMASVLSAALRRLAEQVEETPDAG